MSWVFARIEATCTPTEYPEHSELYEFKEFKALWILIPLIKCQTNLIYLDSKSVLGLRSRVYLQDNPFITETLSAAEKQVVWHDDDGTRERLARTSIGHYWSDDQFGKYLDLASTNIWTWLYQVLGLAITKSFDLTIPNICTWQQHIFGFLKETLCYVTTPNFWPGGTIIFCVL